MVGVRLDWLGLASADGSCDSGSDADGLWAAVDGEFAVVVSTDVAVVGHDSASIIGGMGSIFVDSIFETICWATDCEVFGTVEVTCVHGAV